MAKNERWASRVGLVLAMAGNAVGLGNFLRFPAQAAQNGGGAFMIPYLVSLVVMGIPLMWIEWTMGRYGGGLGHHSTPGIFQSLGKSRAWKYLGVLGLLTCLGIASYYLYIESWCLSYSIYSLLGGFANDAPADFFNRITGQVDNEILAVSVPGLVMFAICIGINIFILSRGVSGGIEVVAKVAMPLLIFFGVVLAVKGLMSDPADDPAMVESPWVGLNYVWEPNFGPNYGNLVNPAIWLAAAGQVFFTLSIGMGSIHCYASYLRKKDDVALTGATTAWTNELCEVVLGSALLLPIAVSYLGLAATKEASGFGLAFLTLPTLFNNWGEFAPLAGFLWFGLLFLAAITSSLAMGQPVMAFLEDEFKLSRVKASWALMGLILLLAFPVALITQRGVFDDFDFWVGTFALVVFALLEVILFAWVFGIDKGWDELMRGSELKVPRFFYYVTKYVTPVFIMVILLAAVFKPSVGWGGLVESIGSGQELPEWEWAGDSVIGKLLHKDLETPEGASDEVVTYYERLRTIRTYDRLALVGIFLFFSVLVAIAWSRKAKQTPSASGPESKSGEARA